MVKRIAVGERVVGYALKRGSPETKRIVGTLMLRPTDECEPYYVHCDGDPDGFFTPAFKIRREIKSTDRRKPKCKS